MQIQQNISLKALNTFSVEAQARYFGKFSTMEELKWLLDRRDELNAIDHKLPLMFLGGGSNVLFTGDVNAFVFRNEILGIRKVKEDDTYIYVTAGAGENWHRFVQHCIENDWAGVENLSLIPGCVGASPMQNIGAYGVEISEVFHELKAYHLLEKTNYTFGLKDCGFGYRDSVFKNKYKDQFVILSVTYKLKKQPQFNTSYGALEAELEKMGVTQLSIRSISNAVIHIRQSKLPDPAKIGNAGSFFKNPIVSRDQFERLKSEFPNVAGYPNGDGNTVKLAAGWLIEHAGPPSAPTWKGFRRGDAGCHDHQALVLVNYGNASGSEILALSEEIRRSVAEKFHVELEREVNII